MRDTFHSKSHGIIEVIRDVSNNKQLAFKLKTASQPFGLIKIGDITNWIKKKLKGYEIVETFEDRDYFGALDDESSPISILMGSQAFYEGWDSNRPNIMVFINIGKSDAKKYVIQAIGRGIRIEPVRGKRKRFLYLMNELQNEKITTKTNNPQREMLSAVETLFIFGTDEENIERLLEGIRYVEPKISEPLQFKKNPKLNTLKIPLLVPEYTKSSVTRISNLPNFDGNKELLQQFCQWVDDDVVLYTLLCTQRNEDLPISTFSRTKSFIQSGDFHQSDRTDILKQLINLTRFVETDIENLGGYRELDEDIVHFKHISTSLDEKEIEILQGVIDRVSAYKDPETEKANLRSKLKKGEIDDNEFDRKYDELTKTTKTEKIDSIEIKYINEHYYLPVVLSNNGKGQYIKHIINVDSERKFIQDLEKYLLKKGNAFEEVDSWMFSKLVERVDSIYIPYYSSIHNSFRRFYPDFIFWIKKGSRYYIIFIDPKGTTFKDYKEKVNGYIDLFGELNQPKRFTHNSLDITVLLRLVTDDKNKLSQDERDFWMDDLEEFRSMLQD